MLHSQNRSLSGTLIPYSAGNPSCLSEIAVLRTTAEPLLDHERSGSGADLSVQKLDMASITNLSTELLIKEDNFLNGGFVSLVKNSGFETHPTVPLSPAIFDAEEFDTMTMEDKQHLSFGGEELPSLFIMDGLADSIFPSERPSMSPSEFLNSTPPPPAPDLELGPDLDEYITQVLSEIPSDSTWDSTQFDLDLFMHPNDPTVQGGLTQECGVSEEEARGSSLHVIQENCANTSSSTTPQETATTSQQPALRQDSVGPVRVRREKRASKKPARLRDDYVVEDVDMPTSTTDSLEHHQNESAALISEATPRKRGNRIVGLSNEEKYYRSRAQNNIASKRCREKRKENKEKMSMELRKLEERNKVLKEKVASLTIVRDDFKRFVQDYLFKR